MPLLSDWFPALEQRSSTTIFYGSGNRDAVDEYFDRHKIPVLLTQVGRSVVGVVR